MSTLSPVSPITPVYRGNKGARWDAERDTDTLFQNHSVEEIRKIEHKTRNDVQVKKEELRQMVGERYRDLIGAADSITDMKGCSKQSCSSLTATQQLCSSLLQTHRVKGLGSSQLTASQCHEQVCAVVGHMKQLVSMQGKIWNSIDRADYQKAAISFLHSKRIVAYLNLESFATHQKSILSGVVAVLLQQWASIGHFQSTILDRCRQCLRATSLDRETILHSLVTMVILDHASTGQIFAEFLTGRKDAIQSVFHPSQQAVSVKIQLCLLVKMIKSCLLQSATLFCKSSLQEHSRIVSSLNMTLQSMKEEELECPVPSTEISQSALQSSCEEWFTKCAGDIQVGVTGLLQHVTTLKALVSIRDSIHNSLTEESSVEIEWDDVCNLTLGRKVCLWTELLQPLILTRAKAIMERMFLAAESTVVTTLHTFIEKFSDMDTSSFLWKEENQELGAINSILCLKASGCSPTIYRFCSDFSDALSGLHGEVKCYVAVEGKTTIAKGPISQHTDSSEMYQFTQEKTAQLVRRFLDVVNDLQSKMQLSSTSSIERCVSGRSVVIFLQKGTNYVFRMLALGQVCCALQQHCPILSALSQGCRPARTINRPALDRFGLAAGLNKIKSSNEAMDSLHKMFTSIYRAWCEWLAGQLADRHGLCLSTASGPLSCSVLNWEEVKIAELTEGGNSVESIIKVPGQASCYLTNLLFVLCQQLAAARGHSLDKDIMLHLGYKTLSGALDNYKSLLVDLDPSLNLQNCALQLLFDVRYLSSLLPHTTALHKGAESLDELVHTIVNQLENLIDPFDLDVFRPYIVRNIDKYHQRCSVMLGSLSCLSSNATHVKLKTATSSAGSQERHNVIPIVPSVATFTSLPVHASPFSQGAPHIEDTQAPHSIYEQMNFLLMYS